MTTLGELRNVVTGAEVPPALATHAPPLRRCVERVAALPGVAADRAVSLFFVPGRVELFGKHTDYAGGRSLLVALDRGFRIVSAPRDDSTIRVVAADLESDAVAEFPFDADVEPEVGTWRNYLQTVARRLVRNFTDLADRPLRGADMALSSDLPSAAGMSSSSALVVGCMLALAEANRLEETDPWRQAIPDRVALATYAATIENGRSFGPLAGERGVGTFGGSEDHTIILCSRENIASQYSFAPTRHERDVRWPEELALAVAASGVVAEKTGLRLAEYNRLSTQAETMVEALNEARGTTCRTLRECVEVLQAAGQTLEHFFAHLVSMRRELAPLDLPGRALQFRTEDQELVPRAAEALEAGDWDELGRLADRSHELADACLRNQTLETNALQDLGRRCGAVAASAFGAGFGGSVWAAVPREEADGFLSRWRTAYTRAFPDPGRGSAFFITRPAGPARRLLPLD